MITKYIGFFCHSCKKFNHIETYLVRNVDEIGVDKTLYPESGCCRSCKTVGFYADFLIAQSAPRRATTAVFRTVDDDWSCSSLQTTNAVLLIH
ncbi:hypothetical protein ACPOL_4114 [Acidisarcina polymorpha]|uniref:Uncharacterized protein n=1 Tax=Acidisarcina polymorpha TaxID=2211140 RepID=A0A2Z5G2N3_9BACT|nr:hypothetical protein [Acidisarcina polymorpha]AXC13391.1 hypothetical protein ACPOL_4114 [Acidisarcina polymorpha]